MAQTLPMLEHDPRSPHSISRILRVVAFSFVASLVITAALIAVVRFLYDTYAAPALNQAPYNPRVEFIAPAIVLITFILSKLLWDTAEGRQPKQRLRAR